MDAPSGAAGPAATIAALIDLDRYPIGDLAAPGAQSLIADARAQMAATGACELAGFLTPAGLAGCLADAVTLEPSAHRSHGVATPYLELPADHWPADHPRQSWNPYELGVVAYDQFAPDSPIRALYEWDPLMAFVAAALGRDQIFRYADPLGALNVATMIQGDELEWHYDQTDFVVSLALRSSETGGDFEVVPQLRADGDERYDDVTRIIANDYPDVVTLPMTPGTLLIFAGRDSIHRVSPIGGPVSRLVVLMGYDTKPGTRSSELLQMSRYGRTAA